MVNCSFCAPSRSRCARRLRAASPSSRRHRTLVQCQCTLALQPAIVHACPDSVTGIENLDFAALQVVAGAKDLKATVGDTLLEQR